MLYDSDNDNLDNNLDINENSIEIWVEERGRKSDTYIYGWNIEESELKTHLQTIKRKRGCNGSIKMLTKETGPIKVMQLQGNNKDFVINYLKTIGIDEENIKIKI